MTQYLQNAGLYPPRPKSYFGLLFTQKPLCSIPPRLQQVQLLDVRKPARHRNVPLDEHGAAVQRHLRLLREVVGRLDRPGPAGPQQQHLAPAHRPRQVSWGSGDGMPGLNPVIGWKHDKNLISNTFFESDQKANADEICMEITMRKLAGLVKISVTFQKDVTFDVKLRPIKKQQKKLTFCIFSNEKKKKTIIFLEPIFTK